MLFSLQEEGNKKELKQEIQKSSYKNREGGRKRGGSWGSRSVTSYNMEDSIFWSESGVEIYIKL